MTPAELREKAWSDPAFFNTPTEMFMPKKWILAQRDPVALLNNLVRSGRWEFCAACPGAFPKTMHDQAWPDADPAICRQKFFEMLPQKIQDQLEETDWLPWHAIALVRRPYPRFVDITGS